MKLSKRSILSVLLKIDHIYYSPKEFTFLKKNKKREAILKDISFELRGNEVLGIVGESGSGKTTLAKVISGILKPDKGNIVFNTNSASKDSNSNPIQILFQNTNELINPLRKVGDLLKESFRSKVKLNEMCELLDIPEVQFTKIGYQLSGGERQRVGLARILSAEPKILILDEPFSAQDPESQKSFLDLFKKIKSELDIAIICISHDIKLLRQFVDTLIVLFGGQIMETGTAENVLNFHRHPYTKFLIEAFNYKLTRDSFINEPDLLKANTICSYFSRCEKRTVKCTESVEKITSDGLTSYCNNPL